MESTSYRFFTYNMLDGCFLVDLVIRLGFSLQSYHADI